MIDVILREVLRRGHAGGRNRNSETARRKMKNICHGLVYILVMRDTA